MVNKIIDGISIKLNELFGDEYNIYSESIKQGFKEPCFFISLIRMSNDKKLLNRGFKEYNFCIQYFPKSSDNREYEICTVLEKLMDNFDSINHKEDIYYFDDINCETVDGVLNFFVTTKVYAVNIKANKYDLFESLYTKTSVKES